MRNPRATEPPPDPPAIPRVKSVARRPLHAPARRHRAAGRLSPASGLLLLAVGLLPAPARAQWKVTSAESLPAPTEGIAHHVQTLARTDNANNATLHLVSFDAGRYTFRVIDQTSTGRAGLAEVMAEAHCFAGTNGGFFQPDFEPVGLLVSDGKLVHPVHRARLLSGALVVTPNHIALRRSTEPLPGKYASQAVQCGPFLVEAGKALPGLNAARSARRTAVFTDGARRWGLVVASAVTLEEFGTILADPALLPGGLRIDRALNLDGGSSTGLWTQAPSAGAAGTGAAGAGSGGRGEPFYLRELGIVRDFVGIVPRTTGGKK